MTATDGLRQATQRLLRAVDSLSDDDYGAPSLLPGWTRAHVAAHLALNAQALTASVIGALADDQVPMYPSDEARDDDIVALAARSPSAIRDRLFGSATEMSDALGSVPESVLDVVVERTAGGERTFLVGDVGTMRLREVEIHHVDLDVGYTRADWPTQFTATLVESLAPRAAATLVATDLGRTWQADSQGPVVTGTSADLAWWLTGRGSGEGLTTDGDLPGIEAW